MKRSTTGKPDRGQFAGSPRAQRARHALIDGGKLLALLLLANVMLGLFFWLPQRSAIAPLRLIPETLFLGVLLFGLARLPRPWVRRALWAVTIPVTGLLLFGVGESFFQFVYREQFVPWRDLAFLPGLLNMLLSSERFTDPPFLALVLAPVVILSAGGVHLLLRAIARRIGRWNAPVGFLLLTPIVPLALLGVGTVAWEDPLSFRLVRQAAPPEAPEYEAEAVDVAEADPLPLLAGGDLRLFVVESYGHTLFTREDHNALILPVYEDLETTLAAAGYSVVSNFMKSPAFGGRSWLADGTILSGVWLGDQAAYDGVKRTDRVTLIDVMNQAGYESVLFAPGMTYFDEGYREFYRFDRFYIQDDFVYEGPFFSFGIMPDQYLLHFAEQETAGGTKPLFSTVIMVSSHVPFRTVPPYVEDWERLGDGAIFHSLRRRVFNNNWLSGGEYPEGYTASIAYSLRSATDFITRHLDTGDLAVVIGDHQPRIPISERSSTYSVPVHLISRTDGVVEPFKDLGFRDGLVPDQKLPHAPMDRLYPMLYQVLRGVPAVKQVIAP